MQQQTANTLILESLFSEIIQCLAEFNPARAAPLLQELETHLEPAALDSVKSKLKEFDFKRGENEMRILACQRGIGKSSLTNPGKFKLRQAQQAQNSYLNKHLQHND